MMKFHDYMRDSRKGECEPIKVVVEARNAGREPIKVAVEARNAEHEPIKAVVEAGNAEREPIKADVEARIIASYPQKSSPSSIKEGLLFHTYSSCQSNHNTASVPSPAWTARTELISPISTSRPGTCSTIKFFKCTA